ncbi:MAG: hypothetical protein R3C59_02625 [Planctomycetaceae bacterium]
MKPESDDTAMWVRCFWGTTILVIVLLSLTSNFSAASAVLSSAIAFTQPLTSALWVRRHDPWKRRGRICFLFHLSVAAWLGAPAALLTILTAAWLHHQFGIPLPIEELNATLVALMCAVAGSAMIGITASLAAVAAGVRVWVHPRFAAVLGEELTGSRAVQASNFGIFVIATSLTALVLPILAWLLMNPLPPTLSVLLVPATILVVVIPCVWISTRIFASGPKDYLMVPQPECESRQRPFLSENF